MVGGRHGHLVTMFLGGGVVAEVEALSAVPVSVCGSLCIDCESGVAHS